MEKNTSWVELLKADAARFNKKISNIPARARVMLRGAKLNDLDLTGIDISHCDLTDADLSGSKVPGLALSRCRLQNTKIDSVELDDDYWTDVIKQIELIWTDVNQWNEYRKEQIPAIMEGCNFSGAILENADLSKMVFATANFNGTIFRNCNLDESSFLGASLIHADLSDLKAIFVSFKEACCENTIFNRSSLEFCTFLKAKATAVSFTGSTLKNVTMNDIEAKAGDFDRTIINDSLFYNAVLSDTSFRNALVSDSMFLQADVRNSNFDKAKVTNCDFFAALTEGSNLKEFLSK